MYTPTTFITKAFYLVTYVCTTVLMTVTIKVMVYTYNASLLLLGWFLQHTLMLRPHLLCILIPTIAAYNLLTNHMGFQHTSYH